MSMSKRGKQDGTGPYKDSTQKRTSGIGKRQEAGLPCPKKKLEPTGLGEWADKRRG